MKPAPAIVALLIGLASASAVPAEKRVLDRESSFRLFDLEAGAPARLVVDNVFGQIRVRTHDTARIELALTRTVFGDSQELLELAQREVSLDVTHDRGLVDLYVNGPFRHPERREWSHTWRDRGYRVVYDFELTVPRRIDLELKTVDGGDLRVSGVHGSFAIGNVNGGVEMSDISGSGTVRTVNGPVRVDFVANPSADSTFVTVNGDVEIGFREGLSADLTLQTTFGELWSEFEVRPLAARPPIEIRREGRRIIRTDAGARVRAGSGGPTHTFETLNGDVLLHLTESATDLEEAP